MQRAARPRSSGSSKTFRLRHCEAVKADQQTVQKKRKFPRLFELLRFYACKIVYKCDIWSRTFCRRIMGGMKSCTPPSQAPSPSCLRLNVGAKSRPREAAALNDVIEDCFQRHYRHLDSARSSRVATRRRCLAMPSISRRPRRRPPNPKPAPQGAGLSSMCN